MTVLRNLLITLTSLSLLIAPVSAGSIYDWSKTPSANANADNGVNLVEGQAPSTVNDSARAVMARHAEFLADQGGALQATGTANAQVVTANSAFNSLDNGRMLAFRPVATNTAAATLNVNNLGAKSIRTASGEALAGGELTLGGIYPVRYNAAAASGAGAWILQQDFSVDLAKATGTLATSQIADSAVTMAKVADEAVSLVKLATAVQSLLVPAGLIAPYGGTVAPTGWLLSFGQCVSRTTYAALFAAISTTYGACDGSTTFALPDLRGRAVAGQDDMGGVSANRLTGISGSLNGDTLGAAGGDEGHTLTTAQMPAHSHSFSGTTSTGGLHTHEIDVNEVDTQSGGGQNYGTSAGTGLETTAAGSHNHTVSGSTAVVGSTAEHNNVQPTLILNYIIKL